MSLFLAIPGRPCSKSLSTNRLRRNAPDNDPFYCMGFSKDGSGQEHSRAEDKTGGVCCGRCFRALSGAVAEIYSCAAGKAGRARRCERQRSGSVFYRFRPWAELNYRAAARFLRLAALKFMNRRMRTRITKSGQYSMADVCHCPRH